MDSTNSLTEFFYNIVPGSLFVLAIVWVLNFDIVGVPVIADLPNSDRGIIVILFLLIIGLFFGFVFQGMTKWIRGQSFRGKSLRGKIFQEIVTKDDSSFKISVKSLRAVGLLELEKIKPLQKKKRKVSIEEISAAIMKSPEELTRVFYLMDNYLRGTDGANTIQHFTTRLAFWSNVYFGAFWLIVVTIFTYFAGYWNKGITKLQWWDIMLSLTLCFAAWLFKKYFSILYDSVLKTFVTVVKFEVRLQEARKPFRENFNKLLFPLWP